MSQADDLSFMRAALALGRRGQGLAAPNPAIGALVVRDGLIVGRGWTQAGGRPHAEPLALAQAGALARGATLYVTLEPCSHHGQTPPCADAVVAAGIARAVVALGDPDPRVGGRGIARLQDAGLVVEQGVGADEARRDLLGHILRVTIGRPAVTLKLAQTADRYAAGGPHDARLMITGEASNNVVQVWRATHDAIMVGIGTVRGDDPLLTVRAPGLEARRPLRVVLDSALTLSPRSRLAATASTHPTLVLTTPGASRDSEDALLQSGVIVERVASDGPKLDLAACLLALARRGMTRVFSEGGPHIGSALIASGLADEVRMITGHRPFGQAGTPALSDAARRRLADPAVYKSGGRHPIGTDQVELFWRQTEEAACSQG